MPMNWAWFREGVFTAAGFAAASMPQLPVAGVDVDYHAVLGGWKNSDAVLVTVSFDPCGC